MESTAKREPARARSTFTASVSPIPGSDKTASGAAPPAKAPSFKASKRSAKSANRAVLSLASDDRLVGGFGLLGQKLQPAREACAVVLLHRSDGQAHAFAGFYVAHRSAHSHFAFWCMKQQQHQGSNWRRRGRSDE